ncbi:Holliday junction recognition protein isoform X2 [Pyrgilauda ruficollis]|uniref:Holliday junction recognition protein isoform X2 n=1 Tax=Pyrgilauda ruficollis TaxID=221976 RepID=UPI001B86B963|nr:Holliday junction recognition protein isoform X2 [Pyrgilauda ruficollis]
MEFDETVEEGLRRSNARFLACMNKILDQYNHDFEDDILVSIGTLTYETPEGIKEWEKVSRKDVKKWKEEIFPSNKCHPRSAEEQSCDFEDEHSTEHQESSKNAGADTSDSGEESGDIASVGRKSKDKHLKNLNGGDGQILQKKRVPVDVILQGDERNIPKWITITTPSSSKSHRSTSPGRELIGYQAAVCRKKLEFSNECSSSRYPQLQHSAFPISSNTIASPRHQACPELSTTSCGSIFGDEECSLSSPTLSSLYPAMVEIFTKLMAKHSLRKVLKYMFGDLRSKRRHSRRPKLNVTVDKMRGFRPCKFKLKKGFHSMCSCRSKDNQIPTYGNESREFCCDSCLISNSSGLVPYACADTNEIKKMHYSDSSSEQHLASGKSQEVCKHTAFPDVMDRIGERFLVENKLQATASPKNSEYAEGETFTYKHFSEPSFITSAASSDAFHLVKESKTQKTDFFVGTSELCSSACSSHGNRNNSIPTTNCSPARSSKVFVYPQKITSFQPKESFSSWKQSSSKTDKEIDAAFDELYYRVISGEYLKPLSLTSPLLKSQNLEEKGVLVKSNLSVSERSPKQCDVEFEKLCGKPVPKSPGLQTTSNFRKYEEIKMPQTVNALVNSPVQRYSSISSVKRAGNFQYHLPCSPVKRLKFIPEHCFSSSKCQEISHSKECNLQTGGMGFLSTFNCSNPSFFADHNRHCQGSACHDSSDQRFLGIPGTSLQESGTAGAHSGCPGGMENCSSLRNVSKCHRRVYRKLSYTDRKDQL